MAGECFIEVNRKGGGLCRLRADMITAFIEVDPGEKDRNKPCVQVHIGTNTYVTVQDEPLSVLWNKYIQALGGRNVTCISAFSEEMEDMINPNRRKRPVAAAAE
jgi:hypothetical protein